MIRGAFDALLQVRRAVFLAAVCTEAEEVFLRIPVVFGPHARVDGFTGKPRQRDAATGSRITPRAVGRRGIELDAIGSRGIGGRRGCAVVADAKRHPRAGRKATTGHPKTVPSALDLREQILVVIPVQRTLNLRALRRARVFGFLLALCGELIGPARTGRRLLAIGKGCRESDERGEQKSSCHSHRSPPDQLTATELK